MHFGKIVKSVAQSNGFSANDFASLLGRSEREILELYEQEEWTSSTIKAASIALEYDFGKYLNDGFQYDLPESNNNYREFLLTIRYPKGKGALLQSWLSKIILIAKAIGLEVH
jgi:hypothetical protein